MIGVTIAGDDASVFTHMTNRRRRPGAGPSCMMTLRFAPLAPGGMKQTTMTLSPIGETPSWCPDGIGHRTRPALSSMPDSLGYGNIVVARRHDVDHDTNTGGSPPAS